TTKPPTGVTRTGATLNGSFTGNGEETKAFFEWGKTTKYGEATAVQAFTGTGPQPVSADLTELLAYTAASGSYHFRLVATNSSGTSYGDDVVLHTLTPDPPKVSGATTSAVSETGATLVAQVNPEGAPTGVQFEYGRAANYGSTREVINFPPSDTSDHE